MNKNYLVLLVITFNFLVIRSIAQSKCDSVFTIKVYDSASNKRLKDVRVRVDTEKGLYGGYTNKRGIATYHLKDGNKLDLAHKQYLFKVYSYGYNYKEKIPLVLDCNCVQKVYLRRWTQEEADFIIKTVGVEDSSKRSR